MDNSMLQLNSSSKSTDVFSITKDGQKIFIDILSDNKQPILINTSDFDHDLYLRINPSVHASLVLMSSDSNTHLTVSDSAQVFCYVLKADTNEKTHFKLSGIIKKDATLNLYEFNETSRENFHNIDVDLLDVNACINYFGLDKLGANCKKESYLNIYHKAPNTISRQVFRGVYFEQSHGTFLGKVHVENNAVKSCAEQLYKSILVDEGAQANVMPQLEIYTDDIAACHGATIGALDEDLLFYLRSRGIEQGEARSMLINSFLDEVIDHVEHAFMKDLIRAKLN